MMGNDKVTWKTLYRKGVNFFVVLYRKHGCQKQCHETREVPLTELCRSQHFYLCDKKQFFTFKITSIS